MTSAAVGEILTGPAVAIGAATAVVGTAGPASANDRDPTPGVFTGLSVTPELDNSEQHLVMPTLSSDTTGTTIKGGRTPTLAAVNNGTGPAATFTGGLSAPQIHLNPGHLTTHPVRGTVGDFYLDAGARLWFCKGATWKQIA